MPQKIALKITLTINDTYKGDIDSMIDNIVAKIDGYMNTPDHMPKGGKVVCKRLKR